MNDSLVFPEGTIVMHAYDSTANLAGEVIAVEDGYMDVRWPDGEVTCHRVDELVESGRG